MRDGADGGVICNLRKLNFLPLLKQQVVELQVGQEMYSKGYYERGGASELITSKRPGGHMQADASMSSFRDSAKQALMASK